MKKERTILQLFPSSLRSNFEEVARRCDDLSEIRIRAGRPVMIYRGHNEFYLKRDGSEELAVGNYFEEGICPDAAQVDSMFSYLCQYSPYAYSEALKQGFLTVAGGHRIGVAGQVIRTEEGIGGIRNIRFLNIRISHEIKDVAKPYLPLLYEKETGRIHSCLIIAPPGMGKTTMLRDLVRLVSDGSNKRRGCVVSIVDERSEIAGCFMGEPQNDVGMRTDVLDACPKVYGMEMVLRSMAPEVIAVDEIATQEDVATLLMLLHCGVRVIATIHGDSLKQLKEKAYLRPLFESAYFQRFLLLNEKKCGHMYNEMGECLL